MNHLFIQIFWLRASYPPKPLIWDNSLAPEQQGWTRLASRSLFARCECDSRCMFVSLVPGVLHHNVSGKGSSTHVTRRSSDKRKKKHKTGCYRAAIKGLRTQRSDPRCRPRCFISLFYSLKCCQVLWDKCNWKWSGQHPEPPTDRMNASSAVN